MKSPLRCNTYIIPHMIQYLHNKPANALFTCEKAFSCITTHTSDVYIKSLFIHEVQQLNVNMAAAIKTHLYLLTNSVNSAVGAVNLLPLPMPMFIPTRFAIQPTFIRNRLL